VPYTPRGFATNLSGGSVSSSGGLVVCLNRLNRILSLEPAARCAVVQPGVTNLELQQALAPFGFYYAPDPASQKVSTLGGNAGENSGGPHCVKYGVTSNHVLGMEVVLPGGEIVTLGGEALDEPGYDLRGLMVGSEGTLGVITRLFLRVLPCPEGVVTLLAVYDSPGDAACSVSDIIVAGMTPATLEMMDAPVMRAVEASFPCGYPLDAAAILIIEVDGPACGLRKQAQAIKDICARNRCRSVREAGDAAERDRLWAGRRGAFGAIARLAPSFSVSDCTVPRTLLPVALSRVAEIANEYGLPHGNVFHAGDGNLHPLLFFDSRDNEQVKRVQRAGRKIMEACVELGGTITGEHGVGAEKKEAMRLVFSEDDLDFQRRIRQAFDPADLLNPGKIFPSVRQLSPVVGGGPAPEDSDCWTPVSDSDAAGLVASAAEHGQALLPVGTGRYRDYGNYSDRRVIGLSSARLNAIREYDPANQFVTAESGVTLRDLQAFLGRRGQWLPLRPWTGCDGTLGGVAALNACGPERLRHGAPRDLILGLAFISAEGRRIKAGGKVVKNVAGYDVSRLLVGSAGTLGLLTEVTFRVCSAPEARCALAGTGALADCARLAFELLGSQLEPVFLGATRGVEVGGSTWRLQVGFEGFPDVVEEQVRRSAPLFAQNGLGECERFEYELVAGAFAAATSRWRERGVLLRVDLPLGRIEASAANLCDALPDSTVLVDFGCGRIRAGAPGELSEQAWPRLSELVGEGDGHLVLERAPTVFKRGREVFAPVRKSWNVMHRLKDALDPKGTFAPGRLPGRK
jgi:glycolate oxidase subunit GlcD